MEYRRYENIISVVIGVLSVFSGLLIQLIIYNILDVSVKDVPAILFIVLWVGFSTVVTHIMVGLDI